MSTEVLPTTDMVVNDETNATITTTINNEQTEVSTTNGVGHENGNGTNPVGQQVESTQNTYDNNEQPAYNKNDLEPESLRKVFIGGLSYKTDNQDFQDYFSKYGDIVVSIRDI
jgi:RNA recognition motif-containing protein